MSTPTPLAQTPAPPYWAVIFTRTLSGNSAGYATTADRMVELAQRQPGYLGYESVSDADGTGITVSYWSEREHIAAWRADVEHTLARQRGRSEWYAAYRLRVARVEAATDFDGPPPASP